MIGIFDKLKYWTEDPVGPAYSKRRESFGS
jgi:hypothetical protein